ncbi:hypothetical protein OL233_02095 [Vagococcus sp. PNs007]|uniref:Uncharacterized protein n=1 Tax=Vagococcus proximus TaxID=2991417 RepID=A0ABT5WZ78_9ENTE|nr:hypothetical protein [Vagococcus proximus]MDF0479065.1 hypothetical protein [Vagococcus proximus]
MKIKPIFRYYFKIWVITTLIVSSFAILIDIVFPIAVDLINNVNWQGDFKASNGFTQSLWLLFIIVMTNPIKKVFTLGAQFSISRKTQYVANLLGILFFAVTWVVLYRVLYPIVLDYLFYYTDDTWKYTLAPSLAVNFWLTRLIDVIELVLLGIVVWFCMAQTKRFAVLPVFFVSLIVIILIPVLLIAVMNVTPEYIQIDIFEKFKMIFTNPIGFWLGIVAVVGLGLYIVRRSTRSLSMK